jgi:hypothetical protein
VHGVGLTAVNAAQRALAAPYPHELHGLVALGTDGRGGLNLGHDCTPLTGGSAMLSVTGWTPFRAGDGPPWHVRQPTPWSIQTTLAVLLTTKTGGHCVFQIPPLVVETGQSPIGS